MSKTVNWDDYEVESIDMQFDDDHPLFELAASHLDGFLVQEQMKKKDLRGMKCEIGEAVVKKFKNYVYGKVTAEQKEEMEKDFSLFDRIILDSTFE